MKKTNIIIGIVVLACIVNVIWDCCSYDPAKTSFPLRYKVISTLGLYALVTLLIFIIKYIMKLKK